MAKNERRRVTIRIIPKSPCVPDRTQAIIQNQGGLLCVPARPTLSALEPQRMNASPCMLSFLLAVTLTQVTSPSARGGDAEQLAELRKTYFTEIQRVTTPVDKQYGQALVKLQAELLSESKLEEAIVVKDEIERLKLKLAGKPVSPAAVARATDPEMVSPTKKGDARR